MEMTPPPAATRGRRRCRAEGRRRRARGHQRVDELAELIVSVVACRRRRERAPRRAEPGHTSTREVLSSSTAIDYHA